MSHKDLLASMTLRELEQHARLVEKEISQRQSRSRSEALAAVQALAKEHGFKLDELVAGEKQTSRKMRPPKKVYIHPENPEIEWSGRGRKPKWVAEFLSTGKTLEDLETRANP